MPIVILIVGFFVTFFGALGLYIEKMVKLPTIFMSISIAILIWWFVAASQPNRYQVSYHNINKIVEGDRINLISFIGTSPINVCKATDTFINESEKYYLERTRELNSGGVDWMKTSVGYNLVLKTECDGETKIVEGD